MRKDNSTRSFQKTFVSENYATEITHCIKYLKDLLECGNKGAEVVYNELNTIKNEVPDRFNFIKTAVFSMPSYDDFQSMKY